MVNFFLGILILQISLLSAFQANEFSLDINPKEQDDFENRQEDNNSFLNKITFLKKKKVNSCFAVTYGINTCFLISSIGGHGTNAKTESFKKVLLGENIGLSLILSNARKSRYNKWLYEHEVGINYSKEMSDTKNYDVLKASKSVPYIQFSEVNRIGYAINQDMFIYFGVGLYYGRGVSDEYTGKSYNLLYLASYQIKNIEFELIYKCRLVDWESILAYALSMGEYTDIANNRYQVLKLNLKLRY